MTIQQQDGFSTTVAWMLDRIAERDRKAHESVRAEIERNGSWWAASEIHRLREQVAGLKARKGRIR